MTCFRFMVHDRREEETPMDSVRRQPPAPRWSLDTPAKINLYLRITGRRRDGYHELETVFLPLAGLSDRIEVIPSRSGRLELRCAATGVPANQENLAWRAAAAFAQAAGITPAWRITVQKRIPVAAGLGGGSSDAGAVLRLLYHRFPDRLAAEALRGIAVKLGADVPFFLSPQPAIARGIGEELLPLQLRRRLPVVVIAPPFPISTAWAYRHWQPDPAPAALDPLCAALARGELRTIAANLANDLGPAAFTKFPVLRLLRQRLLADGALGAGLSGSGSALFAICASPAAAHRIAQRLQRHHGTKAWAVLAG